MSTMLTLDLSPNPKNNDCKWILEKKNPYATLVSWKIYNLTQMIRIIGIIGRNSQYGKRFPLQTLAYEKL